MIEEIRLNSSNNIEPKAVIADLNPNKLHVSQIGHKHVNTNPDRALTKNKQVNNDCLAIDMATSRHYRWLLLVGGLALVGVHRRR